MLAVLLLVAGAPRTLHGQGRPDAAVGFRPVLAAFVAPRIETFLAGVQLEKADPEAATRPSAELLVAREWMLQIGVGAAIGSPPADGQSVSVYFGGGGLFLPLSGGWSGTYRQGHVGLEFRSTKRGPVRLEGRYYLITGGQDGVATWAAGIAFPI